MGRQALIALPLLWSSLAHAMEDPTEVATVAFSRDGSRVAVETHWVNEGPGFPNARIELRDVASGALLGDWSARLTEGDAAAGFPGASAAVRTDAAAALDAAGIDLTHAAMAFPCAAGTCGPAAAPSGCARARDTLRVTVTSTPTPQRVDQCFGRGTPHLLTLTVQGRAWAAETEPADGCPADYTPRAVYLQGQSAVVLLGYTVPGHEGRVPRPRAVPGVLR